MYSDNELLNSVDGLCVKLDLVFCVKVSLDLRSYSMES